VRVQALQGFKSLHHRQHQAQRPTGPQGSTGRYVVQGSVVSVRLCSAAYECSGCDVLIVALGVVGPEQTTDPLGDVVPYLRGDVLASPSSRWTSP